MGEAKRRKNASLENGVLTKTKIESEIDVLQEKYSDEWDVMSKHYEEKGYYQWMCSHINDKKNVLEIGCGNGRSTNELLKAGHKVIAIEENRDCIRRTKELLESNGFSVELISRRGALGKDFKGIHTPYVAIESISESDVVLIEGDILNDPNLIEFLRNLEFDAILCWLMGTHGAMRKKAHIDTSEIITPTDYRFKVQNTVYELADILLKKGDILHLVDRGKTPNSQDLENFMLSHKDQASVTSLVPTIIAHLPYNDPETDDAMKMFYRIPNGMNLSDCEQTSFLSMISIKQ